MWMQTKRIFHVMAIYKHFFYNTSMRNDSSERPGDLKSSSYLCCKTGKHGSVSSQKMLMNLCIATETGET